MQLKHEVTLAIDGFYDNYGEELTDPITVPEAGVIRPGFAVDQVKVCLPPTRRTETLLPNFVRLSDALYSEGFGVPFYHVTRDSLVDRELSQSCWHHSHTQALIKPLYAPDEFAMEADNLVRLADYGFTTIDFDVTKYQPEVQLLRLNLLNLVGPAVLRHLYRIGHRSFEDKRHEMWRYAVQKTRVPQGWSWQPDLDSYLANITPLTEVFAYKEERANKQYVFPDGLFHYATLVAVEGRTVVRFSALPAISPRAAIYFVEVIDWWLVRAVRQIGSLMPKDAEEASRIVRSYDRRPIPFSSAVRLYHAEH